MMAEKKEQVPMPMGVGGNFDLLEFAWIASCNEIVREEAEKRSEERRMKEAEAERFKKEMAEWDNTHMAIEVVTATYGGVSAATSFTIPGGIVKSLTSFAQASALAGGIPGDVVAAAALFLVGSIVMVQNPEITVALLDAVTTYGVASQVYYFAQHGKNNGRLQDDERTAIAGRIAAGNASSADWQKWKKDQKNRNERKSRQSKNR